MEKRKHRMDFVTPVPAGPATSGSLVERFRAAYCGSAVPMCLMRLFEDTVAAEVLAPPNAIGVVRLRCHGAEHSRHYARLEPLNNAATTMVQVAPATVTRNAETALATPTQPKIEGWSLEHVELLREHLRAEFQEIAAAPGSRSNVKVAAALSYVNRWLKQERIRSSESKAGLSAEEARDPVELLRRLVPITYKIASRLFHHHGEEVPAEQRAVLHAASTYLAKYAPVAREDMPAADGVEGGLDGT